VTNALSRARRWLLAACHFAAPLIFFTNLTRNPYVTQITLLHAALPLALAAWAWQQALSEDGWRWPRLAVGWPGAAFLAAWGASWLRAYWAHPIFFRPAIIAEGGRNAIFLIAICVASFLLAASVSSADDDSSEVSLTGWAVFALAWGLAWSAYPSMRSPSGGRPEDFWPLVFDPYGAFLWAAGLIGAGRLVAKGRAVDFVHLALCAGFLASAYGVLQYFNWDFVWPYTLNPYGGRAVSTFGNPNFLSSYNVALMPVALAYYVCEKSTVRRAVYGVVFLTLGAALLATLTRSSWAGALAACAALSLSAPMRKKLRAQSQALGLLLGAAAALVFLWPSSAISTGYTPTVVSRLTEVKTFLERSGSYSPLHQRILIWSSAWLMGSESPVLGKGGGLFELFYPFYQGTLLHAYVFYHTMRTHANNSHNEILEIFSQTGLVGLGAYLAFWAAFFAAAWKWAKSRMGAEPLWTGAIAGCAGVLLDNMLNVSMHFAVPAFLFWWLAGTAMGRGAREGKPLEIWKGTPTARRAAAGALTVLAAFCAWSQVRVWEREAWYFAGFKLVRMSDFAGAARALERSRSWGPKEVNALYELGNTYARTGRADSAAALYREALDANAGYDEIYFNLGTVYASRLTEPAKALQFYETSWAINPLSQDLLNALTAFYLRDPQAHLEDVLEVLAEAVRDFPDNPNFWNNNGYALSLAKKWPQAEAAYTRALAIAPDLALAERNLTGLAAQTGRPRAPILSVLADLRTLEAALTRKDFGAGTTSLAASIVARSPNLAKARFIYGSLLLSRGDAAGAAAQLEQAAELDPGRIPALMNLANAYRVLGKRELAEERLRQVLAADPANAAALEGLKALSPKGRPS
jgi:tetratricopeptide (TPR) repeat protein/O-antigen ligase